jgi:hypothetical protein
MLIALLISSILTLQIQTTVVAEDCKKSNFEGKQCSIAKAQHELAEEIDKL